MIGIISQRLRIHKLKLSVKIVQIKIVLTITKVVKMPETGPGKIKTVMSALTSEAAGEEQEEVVEEEDEVVFETTKIAEIVTMTATDKLTETVAEIVIEIKVGQVRKIVIGKTIEEKEERRLNIEMLILIKEVTAIIQLKNLIWSQMLIITVMMKTSPPIPTPVASEVEAVAEATTIVVVVAVAVDEVAEAEAVEEGTKEEVIIIKRTKQLRSMEFEWQK